MKSALLIGKVILMKRFIFTLATTLKTPVCAEKGNASGNLDVFPEIWRLEEMSGKLEMIAE